jgi:hypothetical protein
VLWIIRVGSSPTNVAMTPGKYTWPHPASEMPDHVARSAIRFGMNCFSATHEKQFSLRGRLRYRLLD